MAAFPSLYYLENSSIEVADGKAHVRATNGTLKTRQLYPADKRSFDLSFGCTAAQKSSIDSHYSGDRDNSFSYTDPATSTAYTVRYTNPPQPQPQPGGWWIVRVQMMEA
jgi:hypothetical protein